MLNSKQILEKTGISRATLNNYIGWGLVPKPEVLPPGPQDGDAPRIGYFPDDIVERITEIQRLKREGWSIGRISEHLNRPAGAAPPAPVAGAAIESLPERAQQPATPAARPVASTPPRRSADGEPVLTDVAVLVTDLQDATRIWLQLPAGEYFDLVNQIWQTADPIFRRHHGSPGKHSGDGLVCYFFPQPGSDYLWNALAAALEMQQAIRSLSKEWQLRKGWTSELYMNTGLDEGQEWLGMFKSAGQVGFSMLATTVTQAVRVSDFAGLGSVWATKNVLGKLADEQLARLKYGVRHRNSDGQEIFVFSVFTPVEGIALLPPVTEIVGITGDPDARLQE